MTLVDTSTWIDHFRKTDPDLVERLHDGTVACHPFVLGEVALGTLRRRGEVLDLLRALPRIDVVPHDDVLAFVDRAGLHGTGIGLVDAHLLAATDTAAAQLLTSDRRLKRQAERLGLAARSRSG